MVPFSPSLAMIFFTIGRDMPVNWAICGWVNEESSLVKPGDRGVAQTRIAPMGTGRFGGVSCEVKSSDNSMVSAGTPLEVVAVEDNQVIVKPIEQ